jgi:hypothetical protein
MHDNVTARAKRRSAHLLRLPLSKKGYFTAGQARANGYSKRCLPIMPSQVDSFESISVFIDFENRS